MTEKKSQYHEILERISIRAGGSQRMNEGKNLNLPHVRV